MYEKLLVIQKEIGAIKKDSENPFYKSAYFDINSLLEVVKPVLNKHGVILLQGLDQINGKLALTTMLVSSTPMESKEQITFTCPIPDCVDAQKYGSAITYFRRYALQSLLALSAEDDDANATTSIATSPKMPYNAQKPLIKPTSLKI